MTKPVLIALSGSTRSGSYNSAVLTVAVEAARSAGAEVDFIDLRDFPMPIFQQDLEEKEGLPEAVKERLTDSSLRVRNTTVPSVRS
jgi:chromate reductase, NAD(P)H dehydrogenase (quinone)